MDPIKAIAMRAEPHCYRGGSRYRRRTAESSVSYIIYHQRKEISHDKFVYSIIIHATFKSSTRSCTSLRSTTQKYIRIAFEDDK